MHLIQAYNKINEQKLVIEAYQRDDRKAETKKSRQGAAERTHYQKYSFTRHITLL